MSVLLGHHDSINTIADILGVTQKARSWKLTVTVGEPVILDVEYYADIDTKMLQEKLAMLIEKKYTLHEIGEEKEDKNGILPR
jgi:hypothetical protein